ncbi:hypothetical protein F5Y09DRAFT_175674 [Xylaria sp. FL1042]|nr:hypothetical protein F5Y09DRAFT_175674 [Xylaria sp. FL1042]
MVLTRSLLSTHSGKYRVVLVRRCHGYPVSWCSCNDDKCLRGYLSNFLVGDIVQYSGCIAMPYLPLYWAEQGIALNCAPGMSDLDIRREDVPHFWYLTCFWAAGFGHECFESDDVLLTREGTAYLNKKRVSDWVMGLDSSLRPGISESGIRLEIPPSPPESVRGSHIQKPTKPRQDKRQRLESPKRDQAAINRNLTSREPTKNGCRISGESAEHEGNMKYRTHND